MVSSALMLVPKRTWFLKKKRRKQNLIKNTKKSAIKFKETQSTKLHFSTTSFRKHLTTKLLTIVPKKESIQSIRKLQKTRSIKSKK